MRSSWLNKLSQNHTPKYGESSNNNKQSSRQQTLITGTYNPLSVCTATLIFTLLYLYVYAPPRKKNVRKYLSFHTNHVKVFTQDSLTGGCSHWSMSCCTAELFVEPKQQPAAKVAIYLTQKLSPQKPRAKWTGQNRCCRGSNLGILSTKEDQI